MRVLVVFTGVAIVLAGLGIYGLLAFMVSMRQQEFGIRLALGAGPGDLFKMVLFDGAELAVAGLLPGTGACLHRGTGSCRACLPACRASRTRLPSQPRRRCVSSPRCWEPCSLRFALFGR